DFGVADHELAGANALGGNLFDNVGEDQAARSQFLAIHTRNLQRHLVIVHVAADHVLSDDVQAVHAGRQRDRLLINRLPLYELLQHTGWAVDGHRIFEHLDDAPRHRGDAAVKVDDGLLHTFLGLEVEVLIIELDGDAGQDGGFGKWHIIRPQLHGQDIKRDLGINLGFQILELDRRGPLQFGEPFEPLELVHARRCAAECGAEVGAIGIVEAVGLGCQTHLLHQGQAGVGHVQQGVLFGGVHRHAVFAGHGGIDELDDDVAAYVFDVAIAPLLEGIGGRGAAALFRGTFIGSARGVRLDLIRRPVHNVDAAAIGFPAGDTRSVVLVGVGDTAVVLFLELVFDRIGGRIAAKPELLDELLAL